MKLYETAEGDRIPTPENAPRGKPEMHLSCSFLEGTGYIIHVTGPMVNNQVNPGMKGYGVILDHNPFESK